jgi:flagellar hook protein FlgE
VNIDSLLPLTKRCIAGMTIVGLTSCTQLAQVGIGSTSIAQVVSSPGQYRQGVTVRGEVINQVAILGQGAYQLKDDSGTLWVITRSGMPKLNSNLTVRGNAQEGVAFAGMNVAVTLAEKERL